MLSNSVMPVKTGTPLPPLYVLRKQLGPCFRWDNGFW